MAEEVQAALDDMVPALKDLQDRGVFTADEIHQIVDRRRNSEYDIRRINNRRKADFLRYIKDEVNLEELRKLRTKKIKEKEREERKEGEVGVAVEKSIGDRHIVHHIHNVWRKTLYKFGKSDVGLYLQYADYCKEIQAHGALSRILAEALQLFPHQEGLWIEAASHEFFVLGSIQNARVLMQQGIRALAGSSPRDLWMQLFCLELHFVERMKARKTILQGGEAANLKTENEEDEKTDESTMDPHKIARLVYKNAVESIPDNVKFRLDFWDQCRLFSETEKLQRFIVDSIRNDLCKDNAEAWMAWALYQWEQKRQENANTRNNQRDGSDEEENEGVKEPSVKKQKMDASKDDNSWSVLDILRQATEALQTEEMYLKAVRMITRYVANLQEEWQNDEENEDPDISVGLELLESLFKEAGESDFFSAELVREQALFLQRLQRKDESIECLEKFAKSHPTKDSLKVWIHLAEISETGPVSVLTQALAKADMNHPSYYEVLLHLFGAKLQSNDDTELMALFQKIALLTPGFLPITEIEEPIFGVPHALDACMQFLQYLNDKADTAHARKVYRTVIYESSLGKIFTDFSDDSMITLVEQAVMTEQSSSDKRAVKRKNLVRLYEEASKLFDGSEVGRKYQERTREEKLAGPSSEAPCLNPKIEMEYKSNGSSLGSLFKETFRKYQVVHLKGRANVGPDISKWVNLRDLFQGMNKEDQASWCIETPGSQNEKTVQPCDFLGSSMPQMRGYCSFLVQKDKEAYEKTLGGLPLQTPLPEIQWYYPSAALWVFVGRNPPESLNLRGRPEHTDSISNDGTWHLQLSGTKTWFLRPSPQLIAYLNQNGVSCHFNESTRIRIDCKEGDILCVNTRLWFHSTVIPAQKAKSVSYARDFYCEKPSATNETEDAKGSKGEMTNLDGLYATNDIGEGSVIFTENDMPNCELHRSSTNANCEVVELDDGTSALVSLRPINAGEFFCVADSDDEDGANYEEDMEEEEDE